jgi:DnaJ-class molecular chaperone
VAAHCDYCLGKAYIFEKQIVEFKVPKNVDTKIPICLRGLGNISFDGSKRGDVWVQLETKK